VGISSDGILVFGINFDELNPFTHYISEEGYTEPREGFDEDEEDPNEFDFEDLVVKHFSDLTEPEHITDETGRGVYGDDWKAYWGAKREVLARVNVELVSHCSYEYPMYILGIKESERTAYRGSPEKLGSTIEAKPEWRLTLKDFCDRFDIKFEEPQWILASIYG